MTAATVYATSGDLAAWISPTDPPASVNRLLRSASLRVALACQRDPYGDVPVEPAVSVLRDATLAQVAAWIRLGVDPDAGGVDVKVVTEAKVLTGDVKYDALSAEQVAKVAGELCAESVAILTAGGLIWLPVPVGADPCDGLYDYGLGDRRRWPDVYYI